MKIILAIACVTILCLNGCATPLNSMQKQELMSYEAKGLAVVEKNPTAGAALGILPGGGSFYTRNYGIGIVNLLLWPVSVLWDPVSGYDGSLSINYFVTKTSISSKMNNEVNELEDELQMKKITTEEFVVKKRKIEKKYSAEI